MPLQYRRRVANRKIPFYLMGDTKKIWGERGGGESLLLGWFVLERLPENCLDGFR